MTDIKTLADAIEDMDRRQSKMCQQWWPDQQSAIVIEAARERLSQMKISDERIWQIAEKHGATWYEPGEQQDGIEFSDCDNLLDFARAILSDDFDNYLSGVRQEILNHGYSAPDLNVKVWRTYYDAGTDAKTAVFKHWAEHMEEQ